MKNIKIVNASKIKSEIIVTFGFKGESLKSIIPIENIKIPKTFSADFKGKKNVKNIFYLDFNKTTNKVLAVGLGDLKKFKKTNLLNLFFEELKYLCSLEIKSASFILSEKLKKYVSLNEFIDFLGEAFYLFDYNFNLYKSKKSLDKNVLSLEIVINSKITTANLKVLKEKKIIADAIIGTRNYINRHASDLTPKVFANELSLQAKKIGLNCKNYGEKELKKIGFNGLLAVGKGSQHEARFVVLEYKAKKKSQSSKKIKTICLVGKGVCFDSGGLSLKPAGSMMTMKYDMSGASVCSQVIIAAKRLEIDANVIALLPLCENSPGNQAYHPGDVINTLSGLTVEVLNTDAEGRIILADALYYAKEFNPDIIIDTATLTGAAKVCLGDKAAAILGNNLDIISSLKESGKRVNERLWELPLWDEYQEDIKSDIADIKNIGFKGGGTITAAKFLSNFIAKKVKWAHIDIAAVAWSDEVKSSSPKGATGYGVKLLIDYLKHL